MVCKADVDDQGHVKLFFYLDLMAPYTGVIRCVENGGQQVLPSCATEQMIPLSYAEL